jgi:hypothetical protein
VRLNKFATRHPYAVFGLIIEAVVMIGKVIT